MNSDQKKVLVEPKGWYESKTIMINLMIVILTIGLFVAEGIQGGDLDLPFDMDTGVTALLITLLNILLRIMTKQPLEK